MRGEETDNRNDSPEDAGATEAPSDIRLKHVRQPPDPPLRCIPAPQLLIAEQDKMSEKTVCPEECRLRSHSELHNNHSKTGHFFHIHATLIKHISPTGKSVLYHTGYGLQLSSRENPKLPSISGEQNPAGHNTLNMNERRVSLGEKVS